MRSEGNNEGKNDGRNKRKEKKRCLGSFWKRLKKHNEHLLGVLYKKPGLVSCTLKDRLDGDKVYFVVVSAFTLAH